MLKKRLIKIVSIFNKTGTIILNNLIFKCKEWSQTVP